MLHNGLYEQIINKGLDTELSVTDKLSQTAPIEYVSCEPSDSLKELFSEGYNADDDSFEEEEMEQV